MRCRNKGTEYTKELQELDEAMKSLEHTIDTLDKWTGKFHVKHYNFRGISLEISHFVDSDVLKSSEYQESPENPYFPFKLIIEGLKLDNYREVNYFAKKLCIMCYSEELPEINGWCYLQIDRKEPYLLCKTTGNKCLLTPELLPSIQVLAGTDIRK